MNPSSQKNTFAWWQCYTVMVWLARQAVCTIPSNCKHMIAIIVLTFLLCRKLLSSMAMNCFRPPIRCPVLPLNRCIAATQTARSFFAILVRVAELPVMPSSNMSSCQSRSPWENLKNQGNAWNTEAAGHVNSQYKKPLCVLFYFLNDPYVLNMLLLEWIDLNWLKSTIPHKQKHP